MHSTINIFEWRLLKIFDACTCRINKKIPKGPPSPPAPVLHSPTRKVTVKEQQEWKIPPCISNWKNAKGFTVPLDKRLAADGRGLQQTHVNENFAKLAEALYIADRKASNLTLCYLLQEIKLRMNFDALWFPVYILYGCSRNMLGNFSSLKIASLCLRNWFVVQIVCQRTICFNAPFAFRPARQLRLVPRWKRRRFRERKNWKKKTCVCWPRERVKSVLDYALKVASFGFISYFGDWLFLLIE